jgi:hypothetical protein
MKNGSKFLSNCTKLIYSGYSLLMFQQIDNQAQSTWTGLNDSKKYTSRKILVDLSIPSCSLESRGNELKTFWELMQFLALFLTLV